MIVGHSRNHASLRDRIGLGAALICYVSLVVWLTWPLAAHLSTHLPNTTFACAFDTLFSAWVLAYETHTLTTAPFQLLQANIFHPAPDTLFYGPTAFGALPYFAPTFLVTANPGLAINGLFLGSVALTAWSLHLVAFRWTGSHLGGFFAAFAFLTNRWILWKWLPTAPHFAVLQYIPIIIFLAASADTRVSRRIMLLCLIVLQCLTEPAYIAPAIIAPLGLLAIVRLVRPSSREQGLALLGILALALLALAPVYAGYESIRSANPDLSEQTYWKNLPPTQLPWGPMRPDAATALTPVALLLVSAGLASAIWRHRNRLGEFIGTPWMHAGLWAAVGVAISISPTIEWFGEPLRLPHAFVFDWVPQLGHLRIPARLGVAGLMGLSLLAGLAFAEFGARIQISIGRRPLAALARFVLASSIAVAMYAQYAHEIGLPAALRSQPLPKHYPLVAAIAPDSSVLHVLERPGGPLLELPLDLGGSGILAVAVEPATAHARAMYRSIHHWRTLLNGYNSYWPAAFDERMALAQKLPNEMALAQLHRETGLEMILVHTRALPRRARSRWLSIAKHPAGSRLRLVARDHGDLLFRVDDAATQ